MSALSRSLLTLLCASSVAALVGCAAEEPAPVAADAPAVESAEDVPTAQPDPESEAQPQPSIEAAGPNPTLPAGYSPGAGNSGTVEDTKTSASTDGNNAEADTSVASGIEKCEYRKDRVASEGNPADAPTTVSGTVHKVKAGDLDGGVPGIVVSDYASAEVWFLALDAPTTLSGYKSGSPSRKTLTFSGKNCIGLVEKRAWAGYEGKHVTLPFEPDRGWWQSDASVPMGALYVDYTPDEVL
ncbi:hypothetical protein [Corynebacterium aurimucosum]|uniref:hypothetical protein n=1 Tax=Corynebacterium aurimucosum TaxID=169292 RepID=UPI003990CAF7